MHLAEARDESGFTLVELLVTIVILAFVLTATLAVFEAVFRSSHADNERNTSLVEQTASLHRMIGELRQAYRVVGPVSASTSNYMDVLIRLTRPGSGTLDRRVLYQCDHTDPATGLRQCVRYEFAANDPSPPGSAPFGATTTLAFARVTNGTSVDPVFTNLSSPSGTTGGPTYGQVTIKTPGSGESTTGYQHLFVLSDAFYMRNRDLTH